MCIPFLYIYTIPFCSNSIDMSTPYYHHIYHLNSLKTKFFHDNIITKISLKVKSILKKRGNMGFNWLSSKNFILYGCGMESERFIARHPELFNQISFCIDAGRQGTFHGKTIKTVEEVGETLHESPIVIATLPSTYHEIRNILLNYNLTEFRDFIYMTYLEKKIALINANCYGGALIHYLTLSKTFNTMYIIYSIPEIQNNSIGEINPYLLNNLDVFIHQDIRKENKFSEKLSDEYIYSKLADNCINITIPNLVGMGGFLFPQQGNHPKTAMTIRGKINLLYEDTVLEEAVQTDILELDDLVNFYTNYTFPLNVLKNYYQRDKSKIQKREQNWDIKVWRMLEESKNDSLPFIDKDHPSNAIIKHICKKVLFLLTKDSDFSDIEFEHELGMPMPMIPSVKKYYCIDALEKDTAKFYNCSTENLIPTYIRTYMWICHNIAL